MLIVGFQFICRIHWSLYIKIMTCEEIQFLKRRSHQKRLKEDKIFKHKCGKNSAKCI